MKRARKNGRAAIVGHSIGAKIALALLLARPELVISAAICSAAYSKSALIRLLANKTANKLSLAMLSWPGVAEMQTKQFRFPTKEMAENFKNELKRTTLETLLAVGSEMLRHGDLPQGLGSIHVPVLLVIGSHEVRAMKQSAEALHRAIPLSQLSVIEGAQHNYPWTHAAAFNALLLDFLSK